MRLLKNSQNKENIEYTLKNNQKQKIDELRLQLKNAYAEIAALKDKNLGLAQKVEQSERQLKNRQILQQEIQFMKEQDWSTQQQLLNLQDINSRLRHQIERLQNQSQNLKKQVIYTGHAQKEIVERTRRPFLDEENILLSNRNNDLSLRASSCMSDRQKSNHCSTPKTKMSIKYEQLIPNQLQSRRRVFL